MSNNFRLNVSIKNNYDFLNYLTALNYQLKNKTNKASFYSLIDKIEIINDSDFDLIDAKIKFKVNYDILKIDEICLNSITAKTKSTIFENINIIFNQEKLFNLAYDLKLVLTIELINNKNEVLFCEDKEINLLPLNCSYKNELDLTTLPSFVTPNNSEIGEIIKVSYIDLMNIRNKPTLYSNYQSNDILSIKEEIESIYLTLKDKNFTLIEKNFEDLFIKIKLPYETLKERKGTILELSLLFLSIIEAIGYRPILLVLENYILPGLFLEPFSFDNYIEKDLKKITKDFIQNRLLFVDPIFFTSNYKDYSFNSSIESAKRILAKYNKEIDAIDILKSHYSIFRPIPELQFINAQKEFDKYSFANTEFKIDTSIFNKYIYQFKVNENGKFDFWSKKLLDLSLSNKLINFKIGTKNPTVFISSLSYFLTSIKNKEAINVAPQNIENKLDFSEEEISSREIIELERNGRFGISGTIEDYRTLIKKAQSIIEETGSNALYLTIGLVEFTPKESRKSFYSPILLIPLTPKSKFINHSFELQLNFDSISINTTLIEYLKLNFNFEFNEELNISKDDFVETYQKIIDIFNSKSSDECKINILKNKVFISILYFANFIIWDDIQKRKDQLLENEIIKCLVERRTYSNSKDDSSLDAIDDEIHSDDIAIPLNADSSQVRAIIDCAKGDSFVLDGPPGTGKSQTIVNMIINALYNKKSVLFVAEKMVALEVVKKRIDEIKLGNFCLELHSNKSNKKDFLNQIENSMNLERIISPIDFEKQTLELDKKKQELNNLIKKTAEIKYFESLHDAILHFEAVKDYDFKGSENYLDALKINKDGFNTIIDLIDNLVSISKVRGELSENPFRMFDKNIEKHLFNDNLYASLSNLKFELSNLNSALTSFLNIYNFSFIKSRENLKKFINIIKQIYEKTIVFRHAFTNEFVNNYQINLNVLEAGVELNKAIDFISSIFDLKILKVDASLYLDLINKNKKALFKCFKLKSKIAKELNSYNKNKKIVKVKRKDVEKYLGTLALYKEKSEYVKNNKYILEKSFTFKDNLLTNDFSKMLDIFNVTYEFVNQINNFNLELNDEEKFKNISLFEQVFDKKDEFLISSLIEKMVNSFDKINALEQELVQNYSYNLAYLFDIDNNTYLSTYFAMVDKGLNNRNYLNNVILFNKLRDDLLNEKFNENILKDLRLGVITSLEIKNRFLVSFYKVIINEYFKDPYFNEFNGLLFNQAIKKYNDLLNEYSVLVIEKTANVLTENFPLLNVKYATSSKFYALRKLIKNGGRGTTIRNMLLEYEDLIRTFCPCFLMSPLSAAQYLSLNTKKFDVVIFDEASQIPTCEAIGAISRGKSLIVAGDPQQMPPTNFFKANLSNNETYSDQVDLEDLESLLDDCIALKMKRNRLLWHYRSSHESLIAFSNNTFYDHNLYTFPSPDNKKSRVELKYLPDGLYENGINKDEANEILKEVKRRFFSPSLCHETIGIVTFNIKQQEYISKLIQNLFDSNPEFNRINQENEEQLFVKNLENVQGDERDVIIFSIGFGFNKYNKFLLNFGPLSLDKGERRLNVAITRAKKRMIVYSSIKANDIDPRKAKNNGAMILKGFLNYAENGVSTLIIDNKFEINKKDGIEKYIQKDLKELGIDSDINVGDSKFKIDLCIKDKKNQYILGVICDSDSYLKSPTCRDRNYVQTSVLKRLNWKIIRIYTLDYFKDKSTVINDIVNSLKNIENLKSNVINEVDKDDIIFKKVSNLPSKRKMEYRTYDISTTINYDGLKEEVYPNLVKYLEDTILNEGPISENLLLERFKKIINVDKAGTKVKRLFALQMNNAKVYKSYELNDVFYYPYGKSENDISYYRASSLFQRPIEAIPAAEIKNAMIDILELQGEILLNDLIKYVAYEFGVVNVTSSINEKLSLIINFILNCYNIFKKNSNLISLNQNK